MKQVQINSFCDLCWADDEQRSEAEYAEIVVVDGKPREMEWCQKHEEQFRITEILDAFREYGISPEGSPTIDKWGSKRERRQKTTPSFVCGVCGAKYVKRMYYDAHLKEHNGERPWKCDVPGCPHSFPTNQALGMHRYREHGIPGVHHRPKRESA